MKTFFRERKLFFIPFAVAGFLALISYVVMQLWNNLLPGILHVTTITFWQAMGIFVLCKILFGFGKGGGRFGGRGMWGMQHNMEERMRHMTPEQREKFKQKMSDHMCRFKDRRFGRDSYGADWNTFGSEPNRPAEQTNSENQQ